MYRMNQSGGMSEQSPVSVAAMLWLDVNFMLGPTACYNTTIAMNFDF